MKEAIIHSQSKIVYIANVMTYPSQTDGYTLSDHVHQLETYLGKKVDIVLSNATLPPRHVLVQYARIGSYPIVIDKEKLSSYTLLETDLLIDYEREAEHSELVRASSAKQHVRPHLIRHDGEKVKHVLQQFLA